MKHNRTWYQNKSLVQQLEKTNCDTQNTTQVYGGIGKVEFLFISNG